MEVLKTLVIVVIILGVSVNGEETNRKGKCGGKSVGRHNPKDKGGVMRKPYPLLHHDHKFHGKKEAPSKPNTGADAFALSHANSNSKNAFKKPIQKPEALPESDESFIMNTDALIADPEEIPSSFGISPRLSISPDGDVLTFARSLKLERHFHDEDIEHEHEHMDEDNDHFHKIRTSRSAPSSGRESGPQQLASHLGQLHGSQTQQGIDVHNGAQAGDYLELSASGDSISASNQGSSSTSGSGTISSSGSTSITVSGRKQ